MHFGRFPTVRVGSSAGGRILTRIFFSRLLSREDARITCQVLDVLHLRWDRVMSKSEADDSIFEQISLVVERAQAALLGLENGG